MQRNPGRLDRFIFYKDGNPRRRLLRLSLLSLIIMLAFAGHFAGWYESEEVAASEEISLSPDASYIGYASLNPDEQARTDYIEGWILPYKGFEDSLLAVPGMTLVSVLEISNAIRDQVDFSKFYAGEALRVWFDANGKVTRFVYRPNIVTYHTLIRSEKTGKFEYSFTRYPTETRHRIIAGEMQGTLNASLAQRTEVTTWIRQAVNNSLEGMISFNTDARNGDTYRILVEEEFYTGRRIPGGRVLFASYTGKIAGHRETFWYEEDDPKSAYNAHYTVDGKALASSGLRLPVDRIHITSTFGYRIHPITGQRHLHNGVDYGGRSGDPVYAVAAGKVASAGMDGASGNKLVIRHIDGTETYYLHLNSFATRAGNAVKGGQIVARLGNTGRSTGPHLHFGIKRQGKWENPLRIKMIAAPVLTGERFDRFKRGMRDIRGLLEKTAAGNG